MAENLRDFRRAITVLKKQGLIPGTTQSGQKIDARSALPNWKVKGKKLSTLVKKYDDVVSGKATALKVPAKSLQQFRRQGFETANKRVIVPHTSGESASVNKGVVAIKNKTGMERVQIPIEYHNLKQYLTDVKKNTDLINSMKRNRESFGIRYRGGQRANFYSSIDDLIDDLQRYQDIQQVTSKAGQAEIYRNLEIIKMTPRATLEIENRIHTRKRTMTKEYNRKHRKRTYAKLKQNPAKYEKYLEKESQRNKNYRASLAGPKLKHYQAEARRRAKLSYAKKKAKKKKRKKTSKKKK